MLSVIDYRNLLRIGLGIVLLVSFSNALAHSVLVWSEYVDGEVNVEAYLDDGAPAKQARLLIADKAGNQVIDDRLDDRGRFRFPRPDASALKIRVIAAPEHEGHAELALPPEQSQP